MAKKKFIKPVAEVSQPLSADSELSRWEIQFRDETGKLPSSLGLNTRIAARDWLDQHPEAKQEWADQKAREFSALVAMLEEHGCEEREKIPKLLRERLANDLHPIAWERWDSWSEEVRREQGIDWVAKHHPERQKWWDMSVVGWAYWQQVPLLIAQEFCILRHIHDPREFENDRNCIPGGEGKTLGERVSDDVRIIERSLGSDAKKPLREWVLWAQEQGWGIPSYLRAGTTPDAAPEPEGANSGPHPVTAIKIKSAFRIPNVRDSDAWWDERMRDAIRYGLTQARAFKGSRGKPSLWRPDLVAGWLTDNTRNHMTEKQAADVLRRHFPDCSDVADLLDPPGAA